ASRSRRPTRTTTPGWATRSRSTTRATTDVKILIGGVMQAFAGWTVEDYAAAAAAFLHGTRHPTLGRAFSACGYVPMVELLRYLEANGFTVFIASGGDRDFMRPVTHELYGVPAERVIGSSNAL